MGLDSIGGNCMIIRKAEDVLKGFNGESTTFLAVLTQVEFRKTKTGKDMVSGSLDVLGKIPYIIWEGTFLDYLKEHSDDLKGKVVEVSGYINEYNGNKSIIVETMALCKESYEQELFFEDKYSAKYMQSIENVITSKMGEGTQVIFNLIMDSQIENGVTIRSRFVKEFAAVSHHDSCQTGLLGHTYKVFASVYSCIKHYRVIASKCDLNLLYLGAILHDVGKVLEYNHGTMSKNGNLVSHNILGVELLANYKQQIIELKSEEFYYRLVSIISQHHGEFGERPRTVEAYVIHLFDMLDSRLTDVDDLLKDATGKIWYSDCYLS